MKIKHAFKLSAIIDKIDVKITDPKASESEIGSDLIMQIVKKAHKAEKEIIQFVADFKGISAVEAEDTDLFEFFGEILKDSGAMTFFKSAAK